MNASYEWLRELTDFSYTPAELRDLLTMRAATVEEVVPQRQDLRDIVIGRVVEAARHPNSDHLWVTKVDAGGPELLDVVCGAPNVTVGTLYPFAPVGATLPGGLTLERRKIRGEFSNGMLCSARELGLGTEHEGILALNIDTTPGTPFLQAMPVGDTQLVIDVLANRADLLSHEGVAREIAAVTGNPLRRPTFGAGPEMPFTAVSHEGHTSGVRVSVEDTEGCPLYIAVVIRGVTVGPSPAWLVQRLDAIGVRSISNVVDVTNYMLHGFGQPMHAFDLSTLRGPSIVVRRAKAGERIVTLDGVDRALTDTMTVIADAERAQAIAGVIGGQGSEVRDNATDILLEVAVFDPKRVRRTRRALGVSTDASYRFERAMDAHACESLARFAAGMIVALSGGTIDDAPIRVGAPPLAPSPTMLRVSRATTVLGDALSADQCTALLRTIGCTVSAGADATLTVTPPTWRADLTTEIDLIEELARLHGYDTFSSELRPFRPSAVPDAGEYTVSSRVRSALVAQGLYEVRPLPFVADAGERGVRLRNPLAENEAMLRSSVLPTLARRVEHNFAHMTRTIRLFEIGVAVERAGDVVSSTALPRERTMAAAIITGDRMPPHFTNAKPPQVDLWDAKWIAEVIGTIAYGTGRLTLNPNAAGDGWDAMVDGANVGRVGPVPVDAPAWASPVFGVEIDLTPAFTSVLEPTPVVPLPVTPAAEFDLALVVPEEVPAARVESVLSAAAGDLLESLVLFDEFRGSGVPAGHRSVAWRLTLRHPTRTLREKEIDGRRDNILRTLDRELGVRPRAS